MADPDYRVTVEVGAHSYDVTYGDAPDYGVMLPLSFGWSFPNSAEFYPCQRDPLSGSFGIVAASLDDVADIEVGDVVRVAVYTPAAAVDPWQSVVGVVSQLDAVVGDRDVLTVYFTDPSWLLTQMPVGIGAWPLENVGNRLNRIAAEAGIAIDTSITGPGQGLLAATNSGSPTDALSAIRNTLKDDAVAGLGGYGRTVYSYDLDTETLVMGIAWRSPINHPASLAVDGSTLHQRDGTDGALDGCVTTTDGRWSRLIGDQYTYVVVDGLIFTDASLAAKPSLPPEGGIPLIRNTSFVAGPGPLFPSDSARAFLGASLVPDPGSDGQLWRTDVVRHLSYLDPDPVAGWVGDDATAVVPGLKWADARLAIVEPVALTLDGREWIAGALDGARLTIPPGGKFYVDVALRPELPSTAAADPTDGATYDDFPPALTYDGLDPLMRYRDLNLIGA